MIGVQLVADEAIDERIHRDHVVPLVRQQLKLEAAQGAPPLAIERLIGPAGPTRAPVVLVHGFAQNRFSWRVSQRSFAGRLAQEGYDVLNLELRGHGNSRAYGAGNATAFEQYVDDLCRVVRACERPPFVIGHSLGGAACVAASTIEPLAGIVHLAGVFSFARRNPTMRALARWSLATRPLWLADVRISTGLFGRVVARAYGLADVAGFGFPLAGWAPGSVERELLEERLRLGFDWTSTEVWLQMCRWALGERFAWADAFARSNVPLLVIAGDADPLLHPDDARVCYDASGSSDRTFIEFEPFEHGSHWGHLDLILGKRAPEVVWPRMIGWMNERGQPRRDASDHAGA
jgi:polyhydroxyalkanoate synthase